MSKRIILHPGYIYSQNDGDRHYISARQLAELYRLPRRSWIDGSSDSVRGLDLNDFVHLYPRVDGNYEYIEGNEDDAK